MSVCLITLGQFRLGYFGYWVAHFPLRARISQLYFRKIRTPQRVWAYEKNCLLPLILKIKFPCLTKHFEGKHQLTLESSTELCLLICESISSVSVSLSSSPVALAWQTINITFNMSSTVTKDRILHWKITLGFSLYLK